MDGLLFLILLEVHVFDYYFDCIFEVNAILCVIAVTLMEPAVLAFVGS